MAKEISISKLQKEVKKINKSLESDIKKGDHEGAMVDVLARNFTEASIQINKAKDAVLDGEDVNLREGLKGVLGATALVVVLPFEATSAAIKAIKNK